MPLLLKSGECDKIWANFIIDSVHNESGKCPHDFRFIAAKYFDLEDLPWIQREHQQPQYRLRIHAVTIVGEVNVTLERTHTLCDAGGGASMHSLALGPIIIGGAGLARTAGHEYKLLGDHSRSPTLGAESGIPTAGDALFLEILTRQTPLTNQGVRAMIVTVPQISASSIYFEVSRKVTSSRKTENIVSVPKNLNYAGSLILAIKALLEAGLPDMYNRLKVLQQEGGTSGQVPLPLRRSADF